VVNDKFGEAVGDLQTIITAEKFKVR
jgi:hypothetical protein